MALVQKRISRTRLITLGAILLGFAILTVYFVVTNYFMTDTGSPVGPSDSYRTNDLPVMLNLGEDIIHDSRYTELQEHGSPVVPGSHGRPNPFVPPS